jgi:hypothetical protein
MSSDRGFRFSISANLSESDAKAGLPQLSWSCGLKGSHAIYVSQPQVVAAMIVKAALGVAMATR